MFQTYDFLLIAILRNNLMLLYCVYLAYNDVYSGKRQAVNRPGIPFHTGLLYTPRLSCNTAEVECRMIHTVAPISPPTTVYFGRYKTLHSDVRRVEQCLVLYLNITWENFDVLSSPKTALKLIID